MSLLRGQTGSIGVAGRIHGGIGGLAGGLAGLGLNLTSPQPLQIDATKNSSVNALSTV